MAAGTAEELAAMLAGDPDRTRPPAGTWCFYRGEEVEAWAARAALVGTGHCVPLVQQACGAPLTARWCRGPRVRGNRAIPPGTAIATFDADGCYPNQASGNHAAIYLSQDDEALLVLDQWKSRQPPRPGTRRIRFKGGAGTPSDDGDRYWVILVAL